MASVVDSIIHDFVQYFQDSTTTDYLMEYVIDKYSIAEYKKEYLLWIDSIVVDENLSYNQTIDDLEDLYLIVHGDSTLDDDDKSLVYSTISIAQHSSEYWYGQYEDWGNLNCSIKSRGWFSWKAVVKNDVAYGAAGGIAGALIGGTVTVGAATIPGWAAGAIGGAIGGSAGNAILQVLDNVWPD